MHPVRFNVISRVSSLSLFLPRSPFFSFVTHPFPPPDQPFSSCIHNRVATLLPPTLRLVLQAFSTSENPRLVRKEEGGGREGREMDEEAGRRREEGGWSRGWKSIPLGGVTSRAQLARARVSFRRGFRILAAVDWRFLRFRFTSAVEAGRYAHRA